MFKIKHLEDTKSNLDTISDIDIKMKILMFLIKDAAFNYNKYLGFDINYDICKLLNSSFESLCDIRTRPFDSSKENLVVFLLEIITNYSGSDYEDLINNEINKIKDIKKFFESLCYYDKVKEFYGNNFEKFKFKDFYVTIFLLLIYRINIMFDAEIKHKKNDIFIEETKRKLSNLGFDTMQRKIILLINELELGRYLQNFNNFWVKLKQFFKNYIDCIVLRAKYSYLKDKANKTVYIERSSSIIRSGFTTHTLSSSAAFKFGFYLVSDYTWEEWADGIVNQIPLVRDGYFYLKTDNLYMGEIEDKISKLEMGINREFTLVDIKNYANFVNCSKDSEYAIKKSSSPIDISYKHKIIKNSEKSATSVVYSRYYIVMEFKMLQINDEVVNREINSFISSIIR